MGHKPLYIDWSEILPGPDDNAPPHPAPADADVALVPPSDLSVLSDHETQERLRRLRTNIPTSKLPDGGHKLWALSCQLADEQDRRNPARIQKGIGECQRPMESLTNEPYDGFGRSISSTMSEWQETLFEKTDAAFSEELRLVICDKYRSSRKNRLQMSEEIQEIQNSSQLDRISSTELPASSYSKKGKQQFSNSSWKDILSSSISNASRKLSRRLSKRKKGHTNQDSIYSKFEKKKVQHVVLLDDEDVQPTQSIEGDDIPDERKFKIYYPSSDDPECVELYQSDIECLGPGMYLSSPIMNFYIQYLQRSLSSIDKRRVEYYIFNTFFYSKLEAAVTSKGGRPTSFLKLRRWWKGTNIFQKAYILLPIYRDKHWSLVVICIPEKEDESGLIILHLDSLGLHASGHIFSVVSSYLKEEWNYLNENSILPELPISERIWKLLPWRIEKEKIVVPQQQNDYDCGLFVLYFIERFIVEAPKRLRKRDLTMFGRRWFKPEEASGLRQKIEELLIEEFESRLASEVAELPTSPGAPQNDEIATPPTIHASGFCH